MTIHTQTIFDYTNLFLNQLGLAAQAEIVYDKNNDLYQINLSSEEPGILIGRHGDTLSALQIILAQHLKTKTGEWLKIAVNINDYRQKREESLKTMADSVAASVVASGRAHALPPLPANERRIVHLHLSKHPQIVTESQGDGRSRSVVISPKV